MIDRSLQPAHNTSTISQIGKCFTPTLSPRQDFAPGIIRAIDRCQMGQKNKKPSRSRPHAHRSRVRHPDTGKTRPIESACQWRIIAGCEVVAPDTGLRSLPSMRIKWGALRVETAPRMTSRISSRQIENMITQEGSGARDSGQSTAHTLVPKRAAEKRPTRESRYRLRPPSQGAPRTWTTSNVQLPVALLQAQSIETSLKVEGGPRARSTSSYSAAADDKSLLL